MPLNSASPEGEPKELAIFGFNDMALGCIHNQFQTALQESADTAQYPFARTLTTHQDGEVVCVTSEPMASPLQFLVKRVEHDVRQ